MRGLLPVAMAIAVFVMINIILWPLLHIHLLGWVALLPAAFTYFRVRSVLAARAERDWDE
jgi:hypothetical protein